MASNQSQSLATPPAREVSIQLWPSDGEGQKPDWRTIKSALMRRRLLLLGTFFGTLLVCLILITMRPPVYRASATLQVNTSASYANQDDLPVLAELTGSNQGRSVITQTEILQNDAVRYRALDQLDEKLRKFVSPSSVTVKAIPETDLVIITSSSSNAEAAAAYANALCRTFLQLSLEKNRSQYSTARRYVGVQVQATGKRLNEAREKLRRYKQANGTADLTAETQQQISELNRIQSEQRQALANKQAAVAQLNKVRSVAASLKPTIVSSSTISRRPEVVAMQSRLTQLELQRIEALREYQPNSPEVQNLNGEIAALRGRLRLEAQTETESQQQVPNPLRQEADQTIARLQGEISSLDARNLELGQLAKRVQSNLSRLPQLEQRLGQLNTDLSGLEQSYQALNQKYQTLRASEAAKVASGSLLFSATAPSEPIGRLTPVTLLLCLVFASLLAIAASTTAEKLDARVRSPLDLPLDQGVGVLAQIPLVRDKDEKCLINTRAMVSPLLENFRTLRFMVAHSRNGASSKSPRLVAVTSSLHKEGKSLVAVNTAVAAALSGERVVLVDCDLRNPSLHDLCNRNNDVGFVDVAEGGATLENALQSTRVPNLYLLTSGSHSSNPFRTLNSPIGQGILRQLAEIADLVIVDTPPVMVLADARLTASISDSVLLVVATDGPDKEDVARATELLNLSGVPRVDIVLNKVVSGYGFRDYYALYPVSNPEEELTAGSDYSSSDYPNADYKNGNSARGEGSGLMGKGLMAVSQAVSGSPRA
jgi:succinoglycan biosynthesis transport protein ExoP